MYSRAAFSRLNQFRARRPVLFYSAAATALTVTTFLGYSLYNSRRRHQQPIATREPDSWRPPSRNEILTKLEEDDFDLLVIGGGATGTGVAVDAATRGLKVALVERDDFASGTK